MRSPIGSSLSCLLLAVPVLAGEGKWTPQQVLAQGPAWVKAQGFGLPLERLWDEKAGEGRLVGVNFDRVWENVANDFGYDPDVARNVNADVRYLLWNLDVVEGAGDLLQELGVGPE